MNQKEPGNNSERNALIIEDDQQLQKLIRIFVEDEGYTATIASDGQEGLDKFIENKTFQLVITDILMPKVNGIDVIKKLRSMNKDVVVIAVSGGDMVNPGTYLDIADALGANHVFDKPINIQKFKEVIREI